MSPSLKESSNLWGQGGNEMAKYSQEFKEKVVRRLMPLNVESVA